MTQAAEGGTLFLLVTETSLKPQERVRPRPTPTFRLSRRGLDLGLAAAITEQGPVSRAEILQRAADVQSLVRGLPPGLLRLEADSRVELLVGLLGCWAAEREVLLGRSSDFEERPLETRSVARVPLGSEALPLNPSVQREFVTRTLPGDRPLLSLVTSGTTRARATHRKTLSHLFFEAEILAKLLDLGPRAVVLPTVAGHHLYGLLFGVLAPWTAGAAFDDSPESRPDSFHPDCVARRMHAVGATHWVSVPAHLATFADRGIELLGLRDIVSSAAVLSPVCARRIEQLTGARVRDILGSTETGGVATRQSSREAEWTPLPGVKVSISTAGCMLVDSPFSSHPNSEPTGDRIELCEQGRFLHLGRDDGIVKLGGRRISLRAIEDAALSIDGVLDAVATREVTSDLRGNRLWLFVATQRPVGEIRAGLWSRLEPVSVPRRIRVFPRLPRDDRGKIPRHVLEQLMLEAKP